MVRYHNFDIVFAEIPCETTLAINITNCPDRCRGCHSLHLQADMGRVLDEAELCGILARYGRSVTCVCFMGGDAAPHQDRPRWPTVVRKNLPAPRTGMVFAAAPELPEESRGRGRSTTSSWAAGSRSWGRSTVADDQPAPLQGRKGRRHARHHGSLSRRRP